jgi:transcriptional regulator with XRE-family HTH domain
MRYICKQNYSRYAIVKTGETDSACKCYEARMHMQNLKSLREKKGYSQAHLAKLAGVHQPTYSCWERGKKVPIMRHVQHLAEILGVTIDALTNSDSVKEGKKRRGRPKGSGKTKSAAKQYLEHPSFAPSALEEKTFNGIPQTEAMDYFCQFIVDTLKEKDTQKLILFFTESLKRIRANI